MVSFDSIFPGNNATKEYNFSLSSTEISSSPGAGAKTFISISGLALIVTILGGNGLVLLLLIRFRRLRTSTNYIISGMVIADFIMGIMLIVSLIIRLNPQNTISPVGCLMFWCINLFPACSSCLTLLSVSFDRYLKVLMPLRYEIFMSNKKAILIVIFIYLYSFLTTFVLPFAGLNQTDEKFNIPCFFQLSKILSPGLTQFLIYFNIMLPLILIILMYSHLFRVVMIKLREERTHGNPAAVGMICSRMSWLKREIKTIKTLIMLLGMCIVGWIPLCCLVLMEIYNPKYQAGLGVRTIVGYFTFCNSAINPIVYSLRSEHFRQSARRLICGKEAFKKYRRKRRRIDATVYPMTTFAMEPVTALKWSEPVA